MEGIVWTLRLTFNVHVQKDLKAWDAKVGNNIEEIKRHFDIQNSPTTGAKVLLTSFFFI